MYGAAGMGAAASMYGMGGSMYGAGMMGPAPYAYGGGGMMGGPMSSLNQFLFSTQNIIFSLGQAVQVRLQSFVISVCCTWSLVLIFYKHRLWE
jgi:hypothetical protein